MPARRGSVLVLVLAIGCGGARFAAGPEDAGGDAAGDATDSSVRDAPAEATPPVEDARAESGDDRDAEGGATDAGADAPPAMDASGEAAGEAGDDDGDVGGDDAGDAPSDAGADAPDAPEEACTPVVFYEDGDGDGYGGTTTRTGCAPPDSGVWVAVGGDCDDSNPQVNPGQTAYFDHGYVPTGQTAISFDYDCSGKETESGTSAKASCHKMGLSCVGSGYLEASPVRTGPGVDPYCGSDQTVTCVSSGLTCAQGAPQTAAAVACH